MRHIVPFLLFAALLIPASVASGDVFVDKGTGLRVNLPAGWSNHVDQATGSFKLVASYQVGGSKYVQFIAEVSGTDGYDPDSWLAFQKKARTEWLEEVTQELKVDRERRIAGGKAIGYTMIGKRNDSPVRLRVYHVVRGRFFFQFTEVAFNGAHTGDAAGAIDKIWDAISFGEPESEVSQPQGGGAAREIEDKDGNFKLKVPAGWETNSEPPPEGKTQQRLTISRLDDNGNMVMRVTFWRIESNAAVFAEEAPGDIVDRAIKNWRIFEGYYGPNSHNLLAGSAQVDDSISMGGADKCASYQVSSRTMQEISKTRDAQKLKARGDKNVEVPKFKPTVIRGRLAMISPHIYFVVGYFSPDAAENETLKKEYNALLDTVEFLSSKARPPALRIAGQTIGDTLTDPANAKARKLKTRLVATGRKPYKLEVKYTVPKGWVVIEKKFGAENSICVYAQDKNNSWVTFKMFHMNIQALAARNLKPEEDSVRLASWKSNWESKARGSKMPSKAQKVTLSSSIRGKGYKKLKGEVNGWPSTFTCCVGRTSGWRNSAEVETMGDTKHFEKDLKAFLKSIKINFKAK